MKAAEIESYLKNAKSLPELIGMANTLKKNGEKETVVNNAVSRLRKSLMSKGKKVKRLERRELPLVDTTKVAYVQFQIRALDEPVIYYSGDAMLI